jgi:hypothetical protein
MGDTLRSGRRAHEGGKHLYVDTSVCSLILVKVHNEGFLGGFMLDLKTSE